MDELNAILERRQTLYAKAQATIQTSGKPLEDAVEEVISAVQTLTA